ncbi:DUF3995 domain-containing protein [Nocardia sp. NPDC046473]|uniref:DUF3995 domain-containing protein n=1 Tax=Nocardia sp. NPDC046473 TaxID=3155733 RepID=UPI0033E6F5FE
MLRTVVGTTTAAVLTAIGGMHVLWTATPWPWHSDSEFRSAVFGSSESTAPLASYLLMGGALVGAGALVLSQAGLVPRVGPDRLRGGAMYALSGGLLLRGVGGVALNVDASEEFQQLNTFVYAPLCIGLAALTYYVQCSSGADSAVAPRVTRED